MVKVKQELQALQKIKQDLDVLLNIADDELSKKTDALLENKDPEKNTALFLQFNDALYMQQKVGAMWRHVADAINEGNEADTLIARRLQGVQK